MNKTQNVICFQTHCWPKIILSILKSIKETEVQWMKGLYDSFEFLRIRKRYIEIYRDLEDTKDIESRKKLLNESYSLLKHFEHESR